MSDKDDKGTPPGDDFQQRLQEMFRNANVAFMMTPPGAGPEPEGGDAPTDESPADNEQALKLVREFNFKPHEIRDYLDRFVIQQQDAKKVLSVAICDHYNHVRRCIEDPSRATEDYAKHNIVLLGPTGVGKTYLLRCIARLIGVPLVKADATKFSETGYVGHDVEDLVRDLVRSADGDTELAQYGIIYVDEIDKIASSSSTSGGKDVSGRGVQINLLKLMEETEVNLHSQSDLVGQIQAVMDMQQGKGHKRTINTRHMLFIVSGVFGDLADLVKRRVDSSQIGFSQDDGAEKDAAEYLKRASTKDFVDYGFEPEFVGRLPVRTVCDSLRAEDLEEILLKSEGSILRQYRGDFAGYGIELDVDEDAIPEIAARAAEEETGARGLMTVLERTLREFKFELPATSLKSFTLTADTVRNPAAALGRALKRRRRASGQRAMKMAVGEFAARFEKEHGFILTFSAKALDCLSGMASDKGISIQAVCEERLKDLEYGLPLVVRRTAKRSFSISEKMILDPGKELAALIAAGFESSEKASTPRKNAGGTK